MFFRGRTQRSQGKARGFLRIVDNPDSIIPHIPPLRRYARALTGNYAAAEDLVQDTLERAWSRFRLWRRGSDLRAWLFTIMHNVYINQVKAHRRRRHQSAEDAGELRVISTQEDRLELEDLRKALRGLADEQREVVLLIGLEQMSYEEAAKILNVPIGTIMSRLSRGREQLRTLMNRDSATTKLKVVK